MTIRVIRPSGDTALVEIAGGGYREAVYEPVDWQSANADAAPSFACLTYADSGHITADGIPVWTVDGQPPNVRLCREPIFRVGARMWSRVLVSEHQLAMSYADPTHLAWSAAERVMRATAKADAVLRVSVTAAPPHPGEPYAKAFTATGRPLYQVSA